MLDWQRRLGRYRDDWRCVRSDDLGGVRGDIDDVWLVYVACAQYVVQT